MKVRKLAPALALAALLASASMPAQADIRDYFGYGDPYRTRSGGFFREHPYIQKAVIGGGAGAAIGAVVARDGRRLNGAAKGALIGAGAGLGYEYLRRKRVFNW